MKLLSVRLENFRQFYGKQEVSFSDSEQRNVTLIYGTNGAGKTTLLNALTWTLYERFTDGFEEPDRLINERALAEISQGEVQCRVVVVFEHESSTYTASRTRTARKDISGTVVESSQAPLTLLVQEQSGATRPINNPSDAINQILPMRLHHFFFFDGERIERLVKPSAYADIESAIKTVLGLEVFDRAVAQVPNGIRILNAELKRLGGSEIRGLSEALERERGQCEALESERASVVKNLGASQENLEAVRERLSELESSRGLQELLDTYESQWKGNEKEILELRRGLSRVITRKGYLSFADKLLTRTLSTVEEQRIKKHFPAPLEGQFVRDLLADHHCICGTKLEPGSKEYMSVQAWLDSAKDADVQLAWSALAGYAGSLADQRSSLKEEIQSIVSRIAQLSDDNRELREKISEIEGKLKRQDSEEVRELANNQDKFKSQIAALQSKRGELEYRISEARTNMSKIESELAEAKDDDARVQLLQRQVRAATNVRNAIQAILDLKNAETRETLDHYVKDLYTQISIKPYIPVLTERFELQLRKSVSGEVINVAKSQGENQLLALTFVGALARLAREKFRERVGGETRQNQLLSFQGGIYPVVMDSPFGALDEVYKREISHAVTILAPQVVCIVSKEQGNDMVKAQIGERVAEQYIIQYTSPKDNLQEENIILDGQSMPYVRRSPNEFEYANLVNVKDLVHV